MSVDIHILYWDPPFGLKKSSHLKQRRRGLACASDIANGWRSRNMRLRRQVLSADRALSFLVNPQQSSWTNPGDGETSFWHNNPHFEEKLYNTLTSSEQGMRIADLKKYLHSNYISMFCSSWEDLKNCSPSLKVTCGHCNTRKLKLWPEAPDIKFACADPLCRLNNMVTIFRYVSKGQSQNNCRMDHGSHWFSSLYPIRKDY